MELISIENRMGINSEEGFTLIELVLTLLVIIILGGAASIGLSGLSTARLDQAVNKVVGDLRYAQQLAISTQSRHGLTIGSASGYSLHIDGAAAPLCDLETCIKDPTNLGQNFQVNFNTYQQGQLANVVFNPVAPFCGGAGNTIEFNSLGAPTNTNGVVLGCDSSLTLSYSGNIHTITIEQNTGNLTY
jgi:type II secretory pathway pseudopilin PulG